MPDTFAKNNKKQKKIFDFSQKR